MKEAVVQSVRMVHGETCLRFIKEFNAKCKLNEHLKVLREVFLMEAGHHMHQYAVYLFKQLDRGHAVDNLYMLNGHF